MSWAGPEDIFLSTSLASYLDKKLLLLLRDGRKLLGILRSFDQYANAVLEGACERVIVGDLYCDIPLGLYVIRGENVVLIGELDLEREELPPHMTRVSAAEIKSVLKFEQQFIDWWKLMIHISCSCTLKSSKREHSEDVLFCSSKAPGTKDKHLACASIYALL